MREIISNYITHISTSNMDKLTIYGTIRTTCKILISLLSRFCDFAKFFFVMHLIATV